MKRLNDYFFYVLIVFLGVGFGFSIELISYSLKKQVDRDKVPYFYMGQKEEPLGFKCYADSLYLPDSSIKSFPRGVVDSPQLAAEIGIAILNDIYGEDKMYGQYPFSVVECNSTWKIYGNFRCVLGTSGYVSIARSTGMVLYYTYDK